MNALMIQAVVRHVITAACAYVGLKYTDSNITEATSAVILLGNLAWSTWDAYKHKQLTPK